tara:strand:+ start:6709 stop:7140 length:432 start_codon:yes stop_codon:yes gene_type:complete
MANGQQKAAENLNSFQAWVSSKSDNDFREYIFRGQLNRTEIALECCFTKSALRQNPAIKEALETLERNLRASGVLPPINYAPEGKKTPERDSDAPQRRRDQQRLNALEQQNAALRAELATTKSKLEQYNLLDEMLAETGRMPR